MSELVLVTGSAGFIGFHLSKALCRQGYQVVGIDNLNEYYDVTLKQSRLGIQQHTPGFTFQKADLTNKKEIDKLFRDNVVDRVVNLAAQAGVRYSLTNPYAY